MKNLILTAVLTALMNFGVSYSQKLSDYSDAYIAKYQKNLYTAIKSENTGLKKSGIYFAGKYEITDLTDALIEELNKENEPSVKVLIALALYRIGGEKALHAIENLANTVTNKEVRRISRAIVEQIKTDKLEENQDTIAKK